MKWKSILILIAALFTINSSFLRKGDVHTLPPHQVKSPGGFDNIAPDATKIITPGIAGMNIY